VIASDRNFIGILLRMLMDCSLKEL